MSTESRLAELERKLKGVAEHGGQRIRIPIFNSAGVQIAEVEGLQESTNITLSRQTGDKRRLGLIAASGGGGGGAPTNALYLVLAADATLTVERIWTPGSGLQAVDSGAGLAYTVSLGPLTADWAQTGNFDILHRGQMLIGGDAFPADTFDFGNLSDFAHYVLQSDHNGQAIGQHQADGLPAILSLLKSRGTAAAPVVVTAGDFVGFIDAFAFDGVDYQYVGNLGWQAVAVAGAGGAITSRSEWFINLATGGNWNVLTMEPDGRAVFSRVHAELTNDDNVARELRLFEPSVGGGSYTGFKAPALAGNVLYTLPIADGAADEVLKTNGAAVLAWVPGVVAHVAAADPHTGYVLEASASYVDLTDGGATTLHSHAGAGGFDWGKSLASGAGAFIN